ncbi:hypothetical protein Leryth_020562 [Lithospermum erythrorhizon]|nr:hypothetical protein Leryth_020562 [Lithospermum erythrorhizon]
MNMLSFPSTKNHIHIATKSLCSFNFKASKTSSKSTYFPARDRVIDFGKHKGKMLGTLPSIYLKWVSKNLRARDFEEWAKLADEVLDDPIYKDRIEWEFAEKLLNGDVLGSPLSKKDANFNSPVSELLQLSERFGWDNEDKKGWSKIDFSILGTSKGGRIPRLGAPSQTRPVGYMNTTFETREIESSNKDVQGCHNEQVMETRKERRERLRSKRSGSNSKNELRGSMGKMGIEENGEGKLGNHVDLRAKEKQDVERGTVEMQSRFPGRDALLRKVLSGKKPF